MSRDLIYDKYENIYTWSMIETFQQINKFKVQLIADLEVRGNIQ